MIGYMIIVQQPAALERQPDRRASLRQNGTGGGRVFAAPGHSDRTGKGMRPQVGEHCVKDTKEEEDHCPYPEIHFRKTKNPVWGILPFQKIFVCNERGKSIFYCPH